MKLEGKGFEMFVKDGDFVKKGDKLMAFDIQYIKSMRNPKLHCGIHGIDRRGRSCDEKIRPCKRAGGDSGNRKLLIVKELMSDVSNNQSVK